MLNIFKFIENIKKIKNNQIFVRAHAQNDTITTELPERFL